MSRGAGHIMDMINRMKQNRALRPSNRRKFKGNNQGNINSTSNNKPKFKTVSEKELIEIKIRIQEQAKTERRKQVILYLTFFSIIGLIILILLLV